MTRLAVVVSTYNRPDALAVVLDAYRYQTDQDFELIVADDGSAPETGHLVAQLQAEAPFPVRHLWQEDRGFRKARIHNRAIAVTTADYLVFTDGDCIPRPTFVARHRALSEPGWLVGGSRILFSEPLTRRVLSREVDVGQWAWWRWIGAALRSEANRVSPLLSLKATAPWRKLQPRRWTNVRGANMAFWRSDLLAVNGFEESYPGWGLEDTDLVIRVLRTGVRHKTGRYAVPVYHLWHPEEDRSRLEENRRLLAALQRDTRIRASAGITESTRAV
jgi:glycosyltransferase involved in cell wall biosynthesis